VTPARAIAVEASRQDEPLLSAGRAQALWRSLQYLAAYRAAVPVALLLAGYLGEGAPGGEDASARLHGSVLAVYFLLALVGLAASRARWPGFELQLTLGALVDVLCITLALHASGGISSGLGLLLLVSLAATGLIGRGRMVLFYSAVAALAVLAEEAYRSLGPDAGQPRFFQAALLGIGFFATAWLARSLARYALASERLATQRGIDLADLAAVNELVVREMQDGVIVIDDDGRVRQLSGRAAELLGIDPGLAARGLTLAADLPALAESVLAWRLDPRHPAPPISVRESGRLRQVGVRPVAAGGGGSARAVVFLEDLDRVQRAARELKLVALGRLTAGIAHEIRNPLSSISHAAELLQEEAGADADSRLVRIIRDNSARIAAMVDEVLKLNRRDRVHVEWVEVEGYLHTFAAEFCGGERIPDSIVEIESCGARTVRFDRSHLNQIAWNLCRNALRHASGREGSVRLVLRDAGGGFVWLDVEDDGAGVALEARAHLFEPFFTTASQGTGLGLYLSRELADANGATLECASPARPTRFRLQCRTVA
jgi:two-component system sensor histidine kinase PilS (NtrC family)